MGDLRAIASVFTGPPTVYKTQALMSSEGFVQRRVVYSIGIPATSILVSSRVVHMYFSPFVQVESGAYICALATVLKSEPRT